LAALSAAFLASYNNGMNDMPARPKRVLIASSHALFGNGLRHLLETRWGDEVVVVGMVSTTEEASVALQTLAPDVVIVDYDDETLNRDEFLEDFVKAEGALRVVVLSLAESPAGAEAIVYDRRTMEASRIDDWLGEGFPFPDNDEDESI